MKRSKVSRQTAHELHRGRINFSSRRSYTISILVDEVEKVRRGPYPMLFLATSRALCCARLVPQLTSVTARLASRDLCSSTMASSAKAPVFHSLQLPLHFSEEPISLTIVQLGQTSSDKAKNIEHARDSVQRAVSAARCGAAVASSKGDLVMLPECWNSPYGVQYFDQYAEDFGGLYEKIKTPLQKHTNVPYAAQLVQQSGASEESAAGEQQDALVKRWTVDGLGGRGEAVDDKCPSETLHMMSSLARELGIVLVGGSIPERDSTTGRLYNTASVFDEQGARTAV